jgi:hypothetical protein
VVLAHLLSLLRRKVSFNPHLLQKTTDSLEAPPSFFQRLLRKCPKKF